MVVLKKEKPILILFRSAFYKEIEEIPKKIKNKMNKNGGCGTVFENGLYFWSNTSGVTAGKMFKKERDGLVLEPINHSELLKINKYQDLDYIESIIGQNTFNIHYDVNSYYDCMTIRGCYNIPESDLVCTEETEYAKYENLFRGRHQYSISMNFIVELENKNKYENKFCEIINIEKYKKILSGFTIKSSFIDYHCYENIYYSPSSFSVIEEIYTVNEAAEKWGMSEGTLRNAIKTDKFIEKVEWRKAGRITLISEKAMKRVYGEPKANNN